MEFPMTRYEPWKLVPSTEFCFLRDDKRKIDPYLFSEPVLLAIRVALATRRPLLVAGSPGCGKTCLAEALAAHLGWSFLRQTITSRTRLEDLTVDVDHLRRLHDAQRARTGEEQTTLAPDKAYYKPGVFWWAFNRKSASRRSMTEENVLAYPKMKLEFPGTSGASKALPPGTVLLIDEIDKAEPDLPNDLLEPLDRRSFQLPDGKVVSAGENDPLLTVITTNRERELPQAFLRRCVSLLLDEPDAPRLIAIALKHIADADLPRVDTLANKMIDLRTEAKASGRRPPGTSEFLDAVRACEELKIAVNDADEVWQQVERAVLLKPTESGNEATQQG
jgi:MoxR-like ATPase